MAERRPARGDDEVDERDRQDVATREGSQLSAAEAGQAGLRQIAQLTGKDPEGVSAVEPAEDGWVVMVDVIEDHRVPSAADVLATYETEMALDGELISYRRIRRYSRGRGDDRNA